MASVLDIGLAQNLPIVFTVLIIWAIVYAVLKQTKIFGDNSSMASFVAVMLSLLSLFFPQIHVATAIAIPWFVLLIIAGVLIMLLTLMFGGDADTFSSWMSSDKTGLADTIRYVMITIGVIIIISAIIISFNVTDSPTQVGDTINQTTDSGDVLSQSNSEDLTAMQTLFHPQILGFIVIMLTAFFAVLLLAT